MAIHGNDWMMTQNNLPRTQDDYCCGQSFITTREIIVHGKALKGQKKRYIKYQMTISQDPNTEPRRNEILMTKSKKIEKVKKK